METKNAIIEVTNGKATKAHQVSNKLSNPYVNPEGKPIVVYAPNFKPGQIRGALDAGAFAVVKTIPELQQVLQNFN